ncbi:hypothetical protein F5Y17DRAFT_462799 [Xylariaceae sp. FL0594]|nr:hypothetical protein F5Y17DRAFT_462799 [Xylariaceae sp. FL0594]
MAPAADAEVQLRFLVACIRHSNNGKVDFEEVRKECDIISKAAAAKRYERLLKAHGISPGAVGAIKKEGGDNGDAAGNNTNKAKRPRGTKRKLEEVNEDEDDVDEPVKQEPKVKGEVKHEDAKVKLEHVNGTYQMILPPHLPFISPYVPQSQPTNSLLHTSPSRDDDHADDDDDEVLFVSSNEKPRSPSARTTLDGGYRLADAQTPAAAMHDHPHSVDYPANHGFTQQLDASTKPPPLSPRTMMMMRASTQEQPNGPYPYGYATAPWAFSHNHHSCI